jgi:glutamyl-tRNA synthetase
VTGRFAPSPTGDLHLGNLRTALVAWLAARSTEGRFVVRMEDLDRVTSSVEHERRQLADLAAIGIDWDGDVVRQSERFERYRAVIDVLTERGLVYPCYCTRREIRREIEAAASAPHGTLPRDGYPGTCRDLTSGQRAAYESHGRPAALRLRTEHQQIEIVDQVAGVHRGTVDDVVLQRGDGVPAYNLAVVVDDAAQGVTQVVRGDDLLSSTPRQVLLQQLLGLPTPEYLHVPLVLGTDGDRLAKRHGAVTVAQLAERGVAASEVVAWLAVSLDLARPAERVNLHQLIDRFDPVTVPRHPVTFTDLAAR